MLHEHKSAAWPLTLLYAALIVYASLYPFAGWRNQGLSPLVFLQAPLPRYWTGFDVAINVAGYAPLGFLLTLALLRGRWRWLCVFVATLAAATLSLLMEGTQTYLSNRVASNVDWALNTSGALAGALAAFALERLGAIDRWRRFRSRWFERDSRGALVLLALWPIGLLYPPPVAFGQGQVYARLLQAWAAWVADTPFEIWTSRQQSWPAWQPLLPWQELTCVALGVLAPCLLGISVIRYAGRRLLFCVAALAAGVGVCALSAALSYGPAHAWAWYSDTVELGLVAAALACLVLVFLPRRWCALALAAALLGQLALLNAAPQNPYDTLALQQWEQGRFIHFHGLAQWVGWLWPFAALGYLLARLAGARGRARAET
ncbi:MAG: VanZ family protein [Burkholderiaceae bacterium]|jgi:VanZ family protein|nr:VanZ family protein [Burkholderiaceae bacterium]